MNTGDRFLTYALTAIAGSIGGMFLGSSCEDSYVKPVSAYATDLNGDGKQDLVMVSEIKTKTVLIQQTDGTYLAPNQIVYQIKQNLDSLEAKARADEK